MINIELLDRWDDLFDNGDRYMELLVNDKNRAICVKVKPDDNWYVMQCADSREVYDGRYGADMPIGFLTTDEFDAVKWFVEEQLSVEADMDSKATRKEEFKHMIDAR